MYDISKGYGLQLTKFDEQYEDCIIYRNSKAEIIRLADKIIRTFNLSGSGLLDQLNDMQQHTHYFKDGEYQHDELFNNKFEIPAYFINLILSKYGMAVRGWENDTPNLDNRTKE